jgi:hypothetical protein
MIPAALVVAVIVGLFVKWDAGLLAGLGVVYLAPELCAIFSKKLRRPLKDEEKHKALAKKIKKSDRQSRRRDDLSDDGFVPINIING